MRNMVCKSCGHIGEPASVTPGSMRIELVLWLSLIIPGLIYSLWRLNKRHDACALCGSDSIVPLESPIARRFMEENKLSFPSPSIETRKPSALALKTGRAAGKLFGRLLR